MQFNNKTLKICLIILCLLPVRAVGLPQFGGATFFMEEEIWKDIAGYEGRYQISNHGNVKSLTRTIIQVNGKPLTTRERILKFRIDPSGYRTTHFWIGEKEHTYKIHRLVAFHFVENPMNHNVVNHLDSNRINNYYKNLEWCSFRENATHAHKQRKGKKSKYVGVCKGRRNKWSAYLYVGKSTNLGSFNTEEEAYQAYLNAMEKNNIKNKYA